MPLSLREVQTRTGADNAPAFDGRQVRVAGVVSTRPLWAVGAYVVGIQDETVHGAVLEGNPVDFAGLAPGTQVDVTATVHNRDGMAILSPSSIRPIAKVAPPSPHDASLNDVATRRYLGVLVTTRGRVLKSASADTGDYLIVGTRLTNVRVFLPKRRNDVGGNQLARFNTGDQIQVTGLAMQKSPLPPYDASFQVLVPDAKSVVLLGRGTLIPASLLAIAIAAICLIMAVWWLRERRIGAQRRAMRSVNTLSEEIVAAVSPSEILGKLADAMPVFMSTAGVRVHVYVYNRKTSCLDRVAGASNPEPLSINVEVPAGPLATGVALAFRNRNPVNIPDTRRSPFFKGKMEPGLPRSVLFVPMLAQGEAMGVLEVNHVDGVRHFTHEEQAVTQHLANQAATSLRLHEQRAMREQVFRSEKLAATGQLISGVASDLRSPLESILAVSKRLVGGSTDAVVERELRILSEEAQQASEIVARLVSIAGTQDSESRPIELNALLTNLIRFREREWKALGIETETQLSPEPLSILAAQGQLEQVLLNVLVHAEQSALDCVEKTIVIATSQVGRQALISITFSSGEETRDPFSPSSDGASGGLSLAVASGIVRNHNGQTRFSRVGARAAIEFEFPLSGDSQVVATQRHTPHREHALTLLLVESDASRGRRLVKSLSDREHRVVPVRSAEEAIDLTQRLRFDAVFSSVRLPGQNWVEFLERIGDQVSAFVLMGDGYDPEFGSTLRSGEGFLLRNPADEAELDRVLADIEAALWPDGSSGTDVGTRGSAQPVR